MDLQYHGTSDLFSGKIPTTGTDVGHVLVLDQRSKFSPFAWVDLSPITNGPANGSNPAASKLGMAVSGDNLTFNVLDTAGADKQLNCTINNGHRLATSDCDASWTTLTASP